MVAILSRRRFRSRSLRVIDGGSGMPWNASIWKRRFRLTRIRLRQLEIEEPLVEKPRVGMSGVLFGEDGKEPLGKVFETGLLGAIAKGFDRLFES